MSNMLHYETISSSNNGNCESGADGKQAAEAGELYVSAIIIKKRKSSISYQIRHGIAPAASRNAIAGDHFEQYSELKKALWLSIALAARK